RDGVRGDERRDTDDQSTPPRGWGAQGEGLAKRKPARDQQDDDEHDRVDRDRGDRGRVLAEIVWLQTDDRSAQPQAGGRDSKERDEDRPGEDADRAEWSYQASACATRSGASSASER